MFACPCKKVWLDIQPSPRLAIQQIACVKKYHKLALNVVDLLHGFVAEVVDFLSSGSLAIIFTSLIPVLCTGYHSIRRNHLYLDAKI